MATLSRFDWIRSTPMRMDGFQSPRPVASLSEIQSAGQAVNEGTNSVAHLITPPKDLDRLKAARFEQSHNFGRNELSAIEVCHAYVQAQRQHVVRDRSGRGIMQYARKIRSTPG